MIVRLSEKLKAKIKAGTLAILPLDENPFADWSTGLFFVGRLQYILVTNTKSLNSTVLPGKGITDEKTFVERALSSLREFMDAVDRRVFSSDWSPLSADRFDLPRR
ncbi:MAG TPA: hypothetical protein VMG10_05175 [Gemmataceae bacterium]|nr:hypothetical protein [Gemmataceae bacterium]